GNNTTTNGKGTPSDNEFNISVDPAFASAGDFHLSVDSQLIDAGVNVSGAPTTDIDGNPNVNLPDIGADEVSILSLSSTSVNENSAIGTTVGALQLSDPNSVASTTFQFIDSGSYHDNAQFTLSGASLKTAAIFNFEDKSQYQIKVRAIPPTGPAIEKVFTISVTNVNEPPVITSDGGGATAALSKPENSTPVTTVTATDPDAGTTLTYAISGGPDQAKFAINAATGALTFLTAPNFEAPADFNGDNVYQVTVQASDGTNTVTQALSVTITDVNEAPTNISLSSSAVAENSAIGTAVGNFSSTDPDAGNTFTYSLVTGTGSTDNASFAIAGNSLQTAGVFDFETKSSYSIRVRSTDQGGLTFEKVFTISVTNVNEAPVLMDAGSPTLDPVRANSGAAQIFGTLVSDLIARMAPSGGITDPDIGDLKGIAVNGLTNTSDGSWQYTIDNGTTWNPVGTTGNIDARLLASDLNTRIRFIPNPGFAGQVRLAFVAWDRTSGANGETANVSSRGGATPFSLVYDYADLWVLPSSPNAVGVWRAGKFYLDANNNHVWNNSTGGDQLFSFGIFTDTPIVGDWNSDGITDLGVWRAGKFYIDTNGNHIWDNVSGGDQVISFGATTDIPIAGDWNGDGKTDIGVFRSGKFYLDNNGNGKWDGVSGGDQYLSFGTTGDLPVIGDWNGDGLSDIGIIRNGKFYLDANGNRAWNNLADGDAYFNFGTAGDKPIAGDWNNDGKSDVGIIRNGRFYLDTNGNRHWDGPFPNDVTFGFGAVGDIPLAGVWSLSVSNLSTSIVASLDASVAVDAEIVPIEMKTPEIQTTESNLTSLMSDDRKKTRVKKTGVSRQDELPSLNSEFKSIPRQSSTKGRGSDNSGFRLRDEVFSMIDELLFSSNLES
ncbi:MAG: cadherin domain-containing protein, partial [Planctomycetaceae bacterium]|nr:cadherin domain-containing protein [Planctomycetaceae bacterium]